MDKTDQYGLGAWSNATTSAHLSYSKTTTLTVATRIGKYLKDCLPHWHCSNGRQAGISMRDISMALNQTIDLLQRCLRFKPIYFTPHQTILIKPSIQDPLKRAS